VRPATTIKREGREEAPGDAAGWPRVPLGELCNIAIGKTPSREQPRFWGGDLTWAAISDLKSDVITRTAERITAVGAAECRCRIVPSGTLLFSFKLTIGKMAFAGCDLYTNEAIAALTPLDPRRLDKHYLRLALAGTDCAQDSSHAVKGKTLNQDGLRALSIPLPPLAEQERMAGRLTKQLAAVARARAAAQARLAAAEALPAAYLREVFEGLAGAAPTRLLGEISDTASGVTLGQRPHALHGREVPYLRVANVQDGHLRLDSVYKIRATDDEIEDLTLRRGDLVLTEGGDRDKLGRGTWWNDELPECIHQNHIFRVRLNDGVVEHEFFGFQLRSAYAKDYFLAHAKQTTGIATINRRILDGLPVLVPPLPAQRQIAADLARRLGEAEHLAACIREELAVIQALPAALLRAAFGGEPGPEHEAEA